MNVETFFDHWNLVENPFRAEEARDDPVFQKLIDDGVTHPDFEKIYGQPEQPSAAVVFGEKGSGKTALRLLMEQRIIAYNHNHPKSMVWIIRYDDLNPLLDRFLHNRKRLRKRDGLNGFRLEDHMDGLLSKGVTRLVDYLLGDQREEPLSPWKARRRIRRMARPNRLDLAELVILYDQPSSGNPEDRWNRLRRMLGLAPVNSPRLLGLLGLVLAAGALALGFIAAHFHSFDWRLLTGGGICAVGGAALLGAWVFRSFRLRRLVSQVRREVQVVERRPAELRERLGYLPYNLFPNQPIPKPGDQDSRYQLTTRFLQVLHALDYAGILVLADRVDEPTAIKGDPAKMKAIVWPLFDNKFLQQNHVGIKLLLPIELRHLLKKEDAAFFQKARLDKQNMIEQLVWSGASLYDLCNRRLRACLQSPVRDLTLRALFENEVTEQDLVDALDQMRQPRDAFKFVYQVIMEHCRNTPDQHPEWNIPRLTLDFVRRQQTQRIQDLYRGLGPA